MSTKSNGDLMNTNPAQHTKEFWLTEFKQATCDGNQQLAYENYLRFKYWSRRAALWEFLAQLCEEKEFGIREF